MIYDNCIYIDIYINVYIFNIRQDTDKYIKHKQIILYIYLDT